MIAPKDNSSANLILVDLGNTHVNMAARIDDSRGEATRVASSDIDAVVQTLKDQWNSLPTTMPRAVVVSSVCPPTLELLQDRCADEKIDPIFVIGKDIDWPMGVDVDEPEKVGTDRLCVAAAAFDKIKTACVIADFGTALTIDLVADNGVFLGGTILPGVATCARALHREASLLPLVSVQKPDREDGKDKAVGKNTNSAINNGIFYMMCGALREIVERYATEITRWPPLVLTGGDAAMIAESCDFVDTIAPNLCLDGIGLAYDLAVQREEDEL